MGPAPQQPGERQGRDGHPRRNWLVPGNGPNGGDEKLRKKLGQGHRPGTEKAPSSSTEQVTATHRVRRAAVHAAPGGTVCIGAAASTRWPSGHLLTDCSSSGSLRALTVPRTEQVPVLGAHRPCPRGSPSRQSQRRKGGPGRPFLLVSTHYPTLCLKSGRVPPRWHVQG